MSFAFMMSSNFSRLHDASQSLFGSCSSVKQRNITVLRARLAGRVCSTAYKRFTAIRSAMLKRHVLTWTTWHPVLQAGMQRSPSGFEPHKKQIYIYIYIWSTKEGATVEAMGTMSCTDFCPFKLLFFSFFQFCASNRGTWVLSSGTDVEF